MPRDQEHTSYLLVVPYAISEGHGVVDNVVVGEAGSFRISGCTLKDEGMIWIIISNWLFFKSFGFEFFDLNPYRCELNVDRVIHLHDRVHFR